MMRSTRRVTATTGVTPTTNMGLLNNDLARTSVDEKRPESSPAEEDNLHNSHGETSLQHGASLVKLVFRTIDSSTVLAKGAQGNPDRVGAALPVSTVGLGDETELVNSSDEGAEEEQIHEGDEDCRALGRTVSDQSVQTPEDGEDADDEHDQDVGRGEDVCLEIAMDEVGLKESELAVILGLERGCAGARAPAQTQVAGCIRRHTRMPMMGIRKTISTRRLKIKKTLPNMFAIANNGPNRGM